MNKDMRLLLKVVATHERVVRPWRCRARSLLSFVIGFGLLIVKITEEHGGCYGEISTLL